MSKGSRATDVKRGPIHHRMQLRAASRILRQTPHHYELPTKSNWTGSGRYDTAIAPNAPKPIIMERAPFPSDPDEFGADTRVAFSTATQTYILEDEKGEEWEWISDRSKWVPVVCTSRILSSPLTGSGLRILP